MEPRVFHLDTYGRIPDISRRGLGIGFDYERNNEARTSVLMKDNVFLGPKFFTRMSALPAQEHKGLFLLLVSFSIYTLAFLLFGSSLGSGLAPLSVLPVIVAGWHRGLKSGLGVAILVLPLNTGLFLLAGLPLSTLLEPGSLIGHTTVAIIGMVAGHFGDLNRKLIRQKVKRSSAQEKLRIFRRLIDESNDVLFIVDPKTGHILDMNKMACSTMGFTRREILAMKVFDIELGFEDMASWLAHAERLRQNRSATTEGQHKRRDGSIFPVEVNLHFVSMRNREFIVAECRDITERKRAEKVLIDANNVLEERVRERTSELLETNKKLKQKMIEGARLQQQMIEISEREQRRIGRDLHDGLGQELTGISMLVKALSKNRAIDSKIYFEQVEMVEKSLSNVIRTTRDLARGLVPVVLENEGLPSALQELSENVAEVFGIKCSLRCPADLKCSDPNIGEHLYRIVQEAVNNSIKHGKAKNVDIVVTQEDGKIRLVVRNDGRCFSAYPLRKRGMGLKIMSYRAKTIGGSFGVKRASRGGTEVQLVIPS